MVEVAGLAVGGEGFDHGGMRRESSNDPVYLFVREMVAVAIVARFVLPTEEVVVGLEGACEERRQFEAT